jgi:hypothetical protein
MSVVSCVFFIDPHSITVLIFIRSFGDGCFLVSSENEANSMKYYTRNREFNEPINQI